MNSIGIKFKLVGLKLQEKFVVFRESLGVISFFQSLLRAIGSRLTRHIPKLDALRERALYEYCEAKLNFLADGAFDEPRPKVKVDKQPIWFFWWQGLENAPVTVIECHKQLLKHARPTQEIYVIDAINLSQFIDIPEYFLDRVRSGDIKVSHLSDIIRFGLLYNYGGIWLDACVYLNGPLPVYDDVELASLKYEDNGRYRSRGRWVGFLFAGKQGCKFFANVQSALIDIHAANGKGVEYLVMDYVIEVVFNKNKDYAKLIMDSSMVDWDLHEMQRLALLGNARLASSLQNPINILTWKADKINSSIFDDRG